MTTKCADWINVKEYVELENYLIYLKGSGYLSSDGIYCVDKTTGKRELLLDVSGGSWNENNLYPEITSDLSIENLCGVGDTLYVFCREYYLKINLETKEIEQEDVFAETSGHPFGRAYGRLLMHAEKLNAQCNEEYLLYQVSNTMYLVNQKTGKTDKVRDNNKKEINAYSYRLWKDKIYYISCENVYEYDIKSKKTVLLYEPKNDSVGRIDLFKIAAETINYDETATGFFGDKMYLAYYDEEENVQKIAVISLDGSGDVEELELDTFVDPEEITHKLLHRGFLYYGTEGSETKILRYDLMDEKEEDLEEEFPDMGTLQVVGQWIYFADNEVEGEIHRIPIDGGDCVRVKVKE